MRSLLAQLGAVCEACSTWSAPGIAACAGCAGALPVAELIHGRPPAVARPPRPEATTPCAGCGRSLPAGLQFCPTCGTRLATPSTPGPTLQPGKVRLLLLRGVGPAATAWPLAIPETTVGRGAGCVLRFPTDETVPPVAATLAFQAGRLLVRDTGSASIFVQLRRPEPIAAGACFAVGDQLLRFTGRVAAAAGGPRGAAPFGSPIPTGASLLRIERIHLGGVVGAAWLRSAPVQIGRTTGDLRFSEDPFISSCHCSLDAHADGALLRDLDSSNGTFVQLAAGAERELTLGDTLRIGRSIFRVEAQD